jgi:hypothetical protein
VAVVVSFSYSMCVSMFRAVSAASVMEGLEVLEQGTGQFDPGLPAAAVEEFGLDPAPERTPEGFDDGIDAPIDRKRARRGFRVARG